MRLDLHKAVHGGLELAASTTHTTDKDASEVDYSYLKTEVAAAANVEEDAVTLSPWLECDGVEQPDYEGTCPEGEALSRYLQLRVEKTYSPMFRIGPVGPSDVALFAEAAVRVQ
jgi:hypothetical protein